MRRHALPSNAIDRARQLRRSATDAQSRLWYVLRDKLPAAKFRGKVPFGRYVVDFASHSAKLILEVDGSQHAEARKYDAIRTGLLNADGYRVLRFWNNEVLTNLDGVLAVIAAAIPSPPVGEGGPKGRMRGARPCRAPAALAGTPHPLPSPRRGEGEQVKICDFGVN